MCRKLGLKKYRMLHGDEYVKAKAHRQLMHGVFSCGEYDLALDRTINDLMAIYGKHPRYSRIRHVRKLIKYYNLT